MLKALIGLSWCLSWSLALAAELTVYAVKSPVTINWKTPRSLLLTGLMSELSLGAPRKIGHVFVGYRCEGEEEVITGMTSGPDFKAREHLLKRGHGLTVLLEDNAGELESDASARADIESLTHTRRMAILKISISEEQCHQMQQWQQSYAARTPLIYGGLSRRPLRGEGAGCSAYGMSFLEVADVEFATFNSLFETTVYLPEELLGGELGKGHVSVWQILADRTPLALPRASSLEVKLYDPNTIYRWIKTEWAKAQRHENSAILPDYQRSISKRGRTPVLTLTRESGK